MTVEQIEAIRARIPSGDLKAWREECTAQGHSPKQLETGSGKGALYYCQRCYDWPVPPPAS